MPPKTARAAGKAAKATAAMVTATAGATTTATKNHDQTGEMIVIATSIGEIEVVNVDPHGT